MGVDEALWHRLNDDFCSFKDKKKAPKQNFCRNQYNNTGLCNRASCPLANSQYATVIEDEGVNYLYMKTAERAHTPKNLWQRVKLSKNYLQALEQISNHLKGWSAHMINRCKQRLTKTRQMLIKMRGLSARDAPRSRLTAIKKKTERRELSREIQAEKAAKVDSNIEKELLARLRQGIYGNTYNFSRKPREGLLDKQKNEEEDKDEDDVETQFEEDLDDDDGLDEEEREEEHQVEEVELEDDLSGALQDLEDIADVAAAVRPKKKKRRGLRPAPSGYRVELEYEEEMEAR